MTTELLQRLEKAERLRSASRAERIARRPLAMAAPWLLRKAGRTWQTSCETFFGERMHIVLPETVSTELLRYGFFEADVCRTLIALLKPGDTFFDIGSHFGFFSMLARSLCGPDGQVVAFEPTPSTARITERNLQRWANTRVINKACWEEPSTVSINDYGLANSAFNSLLGPRSGADEPAALTARTVTVEAIDLDTISAELGFTPSFVKIDAESSELPILRGMSRTLAQARPILSIEVGDFGVEGAAPSRDIVSYLESRGYSAHRYTPHGLERHERQERYGYENLFFLPDRRAP